MSATLTHQVVINGEGRHSLWPASRRLPAGWRQVLAASTRETCLEHVAKHWDALTTKPRAGAALAVKKGIAFSLMFFGSDEGKAAREKYEMVIAAAKVADEGGLSAVWVPERHFTSMGSLYPNPAVLHAALARETRRIRLRAGSVVLPLHHPIRVAEEWAVVDNLSNGRVELSFAPGWNTGDFILAPDRYDSRYDVMYAGMEQVRRLWAGEPFEGIDGAGKPVRVRTYPTPVQKTLPMWITAAGSERSFQQAGKMGVDLLTHLFDQDVETLARKVSLYREARQDAGHDPASGRVAVALHTYVGGTLDEVQEQVRGPYANYLKSNMGLLEKLAHSRGMTLDMSKLPAADLSGAIEWLFEKFLSQRSLMGTVESCVPLVEKLVACGVQEVACLVDFGPSPRSILDSLPRLCKLQERFRS
jgi:phthiocerol/phenolphthiocerol synthesis type-I polyketide synthase D